MSELEKVRKIINAHDTDPKRCPYCFRNLRAKLIKSDSSVRYYCSLCEQYIDLEWDYLHAIAKNLENYLVFKDGSSVYNFKRSDKQ